MRAALVLCLAVLITGCGASSPAPAATGSPSGSQGPASGTRIEQPTGTPPTPPGSSVPAFACADASGGRVGVANVVTARVAAQAGYDRFVLQFDSMVPSYTVKRQASPAFPAGASGQTIRLSGTSGALIKVSTATGAGTFTGPADFTHADYLVLKEARQTEDFEGHVSWGMGLAKAACIRTFTLTDPPRLVVDFSTTSS